MIAGPEHVRLHHSPHTADLELDNLGREQQDTSAYPLRDTLSRPSTRPNLSYIRTRVPLPTIISPSGERQVDLAKLPLLLDPDDTRSQDTLLPRWRN